MQLPTKKHIVSIKNNSQLMIFQGILNSSSTGIEVSSSKIILVIWFSNKEIVYLSWWKTWEKSLKHLNNSEQTSPGGIKCTFINIFSCMVRLLHHRQLHGHPPFGEPRKCWSDFRLCQTYFTCKFLHFPYIQWVGRALKCTSTLHTEMYWTGHGEAIDFA